MVIRPSILHRIERCPGSVRQCAAVPIKEEPEESYASIGTRIHESVSGGLLHPDLRLSILAECDNQDVVEACWIEAEKCWNDLSPEQRKRAIVLVEKPVDLSQFGMKQGTPDFAIIIAGTETESGRIILRDWKSGMGWVAPAKYNLQLLTYGSGLSRAYNIDGPVDIGIVQPLVRQYPDIWVASQEDLTTVAERIKHVIEACLKEDAPLFPGGWCQYCAAKDTCPARMQIAAEVKQITDPVTTMQAISPEARKDLYDKLKNAIDILEKAKEQIDAAIIANTLDVKGYGPGEGRKGRFWRGDKNDTIAALSALGDTKGLSMLDIVDPITIGGAEKLFGKQAIEGLIAVKEGKPTVRHKKG